MNALWAVRGVCECSCVRIERMNATGVDPDRWRWRARSVVRRCASFKPLDDDHAAAAAGTEICRFRLGSTGTHCFDSLNGNDLRHGQFGGAGDVLGAFAAGEQAIVADAVEARGEHVDEKSADELVR